MSPSGRPTVSSPDGPDRGQPTVFVPRRRFGRAIGLFLPIHELPGPVNLESLTTASFSEPGTFLLRAVAYDGDWYDSRNVTVTVTE